MRDAVDVIIQARMDSTRLPRKIMLPIDDKPMLAHLIERMQIAETIRHIIIATTEDSFSPIRHLLRKYPDVKFYVGSKEDVLERYYHAAKTFNSRIIVRATGDNPLTDPQFLDRAVEIHLSSGSDLTHYLGIPLGTGVEVISQPALLQAYQDSELRYDREHVTPYIYKHRRIFKVLEPVATGKYYNPNLRVTVDTAVDLDVVRELFKHYHSNMFISMEDLIDFFRLKTRASTMITPSRMEMFNYSDPVA